MANILLMVKGSEGDVFPFIQIGEALRMRHHTVTLFTHCYYEDVVRKAGLDFISLDTPQALEQMLKDQHLFVDPSQIATYYRRHIIPRILTEYELIAAQCQAADTVIVSHYNLQLTAQLVAEALEIPFALVFLSPAQIINLPILGRLLHLLADDLNLVRNTLGLSPVQNWDSWLKSVHHGIALWPAWFATPTSDWPSGITPTGFIRRSDATDAIPSEIQTLLEAETPPVLITVGTGMWALESEFYAVTAAACGELGQPGILATQRKELIPPNLPNEVKWASHLPFPRVLPQLKAIIHHGGIGTCVQSLAAGIPQLILAAGFDRPDNAARLQELGAAVFLPPSKWQLNIVADALRQLAESAGTQARCKEIAGWMREADATNDVCSLIEAKLLPAQKPARMKFLMVQNLIYLPTYGGANKCDRLLLEGLAAQGHICRVIAPATGAQGLEGYPQFLEALKQHGIHPISYPDVDVFQYNGVEVHAVKDSAQLPAQLRRQIQSFAPTWTLISSEDPGQILLSAALRATPDRVVYMAHTPQMLPFGPRCFFPSASRTALLRQVAGIITVSQYLQEQIQNWSGLKSTVLHFPVYGPGPFPRYGEFDRGFVTLINPCAYKGIAIFLGLARALPHIQFAAVPTWGATHAELNALEQLPNITILLPTDDVDQIYAQTRVLLAPSLCDEAFGLVAVEAMLRGIPVLASNFGGLAEAKLGVDYLLPVQPIERYENRFDERAKPIAIVPEQDIQPWLAALEQLLANREHYDQLAAASREAALAFAANARIQSFEEFFRHLTPAKPVTGAVPDAIPTATKTEDAQKDLPLNLSPERRALLALRLKKKARGQSSNDG